MALCKSVFSLCLLSVLVWSPFCCGGAPAQWKSRTIYQVLTDRFAKSSDTTQGCNNLGTYCGGTFAGLTKHLDYIQGMGFDAIWISPIVDNTPGGYHGYWARNIYQINTNFGSAADLLNLVKACHSKGIWVMVDVVANHVGPVGYDYSSIFPFNQPSHYHDCNGCPSGCSISDYTNPTQTEHCRLSGLPDLDQSNNYVASTLNSWIKNLTSFYGIDGLRIDTVAEVLPSFWPGFQQAAGVYAIGEVFDSRISFVAGFTKLIDATLSYPLAFTLRGVFQNRNSMNDIQSTLQQYNSAGFSNLDVLGTFVDNHDNARFLNGQSDWKLFQNALAYVILGQGIPIVYYGSEQGFAGGNDPNNREVLWPTGFNTNTVLYQHIKTLVQVRKHAQVWNFPQVQRYSDNNFYAFTRGNTFVALTNGGTSQATLSRTITYHPYSNGQKLCNVFYNTTDCVTVSGGQFSVVLNQGEAKVFLPA